MAENKMHAAWKKYCESNAQQKNILEQIERLLKVIREEELSDDAFIAKLNAIPEALLADLQKLVPPPPQRWEAGIDAWAALLNAVETGDEASRLAKFIVARANGPLGQTRLASNVIKALAQGKTVDQILSSQPAAQPAQPAAQTAKRTEPEKEEGENLLDRIPTIGGRSPWVTITSGVGILLVACIGIGWLVLSLLGGPAEPLAPADATATAEAEFFSETGGGEPFTIEEVALPTATLEPTATPKPRPTQAFSALATGCTLTNGERGYVVYERLPRRDVVKNEMQGSTELAMETPAGPPIEYTLYVLTPVQSASPAVLLMHTGEGAYFVPADYFPPLAGETPRCVPRGQYPSFDTAFSQTMPQIGTALNVMAGEWWTWPTAIVLGLLILGVGIEVVLKKEYLAGPLFVILVLGLAYITDPDLTMTKLAVLHLVGLAAACALGYRGEVGEIGEAADRTEDKSGVSDEVEEVIELGQGWEYILNSFDWSKPGWYAGFSIMLGVLFPENSPLFMVMDPFWATLILGFEGLLFFGLETLRRGEAADRWGYLVAEIAGSVFIAEALMFERGSSQQIIAVLLTAIVALGLSIGIGLIGFRAVSRDRLAEMLSAAGTTALCGMVIIARLPAG